MNDPLNQLDLYDSPINHSLINRSSKLKGIHRILDVGAGTGGNLRGLKYLHPNAETVAITCSQREAEMLQEVADQTLITDLNQLKTEQALQATGLTSRRFDLIIFSHVLEHLQEPAQILANISSLLDSDGIILVALPNICHWRTRLLITRGQFKYQETGVLDRSHLRFFTYWTAVEMIQQCATLELIQHHPIGGFILGPLRSLLPNIATNWIDRQAVRIWPNLFGFEAHLLAQRSK